MLISELPYGNYNIRLKAQGANGHWVDYEKPIPLVVLRPFYSSLWFVLLLLAFSAFLIWGLLRLRVAQLEKGKKELEKIVVERTATIQQQAEELKALDKAKSRFFANVSHELRTPLTLILGPLSYILDDPEAWDDITLRKQLLTMQRNGKSLLQLVEEILDLSKLEAQKMELQKEPTALASFFEQIFNTFEPQFKSLGLLSEFHIAATLSTTIVLLDRRKMEKVVNNYLSNAIKFTPRTGIITLNISEKDNNLLLSVADNGKGIHPKDQPHVFERFYQTAEDASALRGGTGIGLALVKEFAGLLNGKAYIESELDKGATFYFSWPKEICTAIPEIASETILTTVIEHQQPEELISHIGTDFTVLVVEDNDDMRSFIETLLQKHYKVLLAKNGLEGIEILEANPTKVNLIVSDVMMPEMDGFTMLKIIKSNPDFRNIPIIMLTALVAEKDKLGALRIGVDDYLTKPFSIEELKVRVQNLLYNYQQRLTWKAWEEEVPVSEKELVNEVVEDVETDEISEADQIWVKEIESRIVELMQTKVPNSEELAKLFFLSQRQFTRRLKKITGLTPAKFIREVQLQKARTILESGKAVSVTETAYTCGFEVSDTFSRLYKQRFGKNPSEYMK